MDITEKDYKPHWKGPVPIPEVQLYARPRGNCQWQCPDCGNLHGTSQELWNRARVQCRRERCEHKFRVGVGITKNDKHAFALWGGNWYREVANKKDPQGKEIPGRLYGEIDWRCPACDLAQTYHAEFKNPKVVCRSCGDWWYLQLILYAPRGPKLICPYDWTVFDAKQPTHESVPAEASSTSAGTSGDSLGNHSEDLNQ